MDQVVNRSVWRPRFSASLLGGFAALALLLAAVGMYGVMAYGVSQRTREIGIRMALGARPAGRVAPRVGRRRETRRVGDAPSESGGALLLTRYLETLLYHVKATDPAVLAGSATALAAVALLAAWLPARRATRVDPAIALRNE